MAKLRESPAALYLGCSVYKLQKDRRAGSPIPYIKLGRTVLYRTEDLDAYLAQRTFTSTSQYGGKNDK